jgi:hypothetical protein
MKSGLLPFRHFFLLEALKLMLKAISHNFIHWKNNVGCRYTAVMTLTQLKIEQETLYGCLCSKINVTSNYIRYRLR